MTKKLTPRDIEILRECLRITIDNIRRNSSKLLVLIPELDGKVPVLSELLDKMYDITEDLKHND